MGNHASILDTLMASVASPVCVTDATGHVTRCNAAFAALVAAEAHCADHVRQVLENGVPQAGTIHLPDQPTPWALSATPVVEADQIVGAIVILWPPAAAHAAPTDGLDNLTGLPGRHLFFDRVDQLLHHAGRAQKSVAVILVGIERLGQIADVLGSEAINRILRDIAERLRQCVRVSDTVARLDNERFAFVMQISAINDSVLLTEKILHAFEQPFTFGQHEDVVISCALGVSIYPADGANGEALVKSASSALHHAAQSGANQCQFFSNEMNDRARHRLTVESGIRRGLSNREFLVYYQPKIDVNNRRVAGMEALIRWRDPARGLVSPAEFIPVAEESGLIEQIGQWVLEETCAQNQRWQAEGLPPVKASVNVSARQFRNRNFVAQVEEVLARTGLDPRWLELEITESMLMGDMEAIIKRMEDIRRVGVSLSIDDFGTGYSSLSYLSRFPITTLKIDRAFIADVQTNPHTAEIARAIIGLSRGLDLEVVAEGAEVIEQIDFLRAHGCELVQGFYYSRPLPAEEFALMLRNGPGTHHA
ncbi:MAG: bifunctional diguanylate cyclase/phosphodiesterase [Rhodocyclaceae bacterium]|nr:bifunctional diguanylate cyclase/phosphodiesterase [Rhodocyclaceae bacterium]MDZ4216045.1 bifunctional diguanylate cyclase/phosphodiesterase [Rhodocyclaceae bacterium]